MKALVGGLLGLTLTMGGSVGALAASPAPAASPVPDDRLVAEAIARLDDLDSFQFSTSTTEDSAPDTVFGLAGVIIHEPDRAWQVAMLADGEPSFIQIVDGEEGWTSFLGSTFRSLEEQESSVPEEPPPLFDVLDRWAAEHVPMVQVGRETIDGADVLHYRGQTVQVEITPDPNGYYRRSLTGSLDLWVDAERGYLVKAVGDIVDVGYTFSNRADPVARHLDVRISGVDDPANRVSRPDLDAVLPSPQPGDPALAPMVNAAFANLADLDSYRTELQSIVSGFVGGEETLIINRPVPAARSIMRVSGDEVIAYQDIDGVLSTRTSEDAPWVVTAAEDMPTCDDVPCGFASASRLGTLEKTEAGSFRLVGEETLDGMAVTHLRSEAPMVYEGLGTVPQVTDLWIAKDGGYLKRLEVDGVGQSSFLAVSAENDPANVIEVPAAPAPSAAP